MSHNTNALDRGIRIVLGLALLAIFFFGPKTAWGLLGLIPLLTGTFGHCPLYRALGISTNDAPGRPRHQH
ncbi:MAG TPA: DUF2892 domain-containing protein [Polyangiaceae bacterium]|nr:DUF2892 domain-containing protein [Polyangiaceae bacterium]